MSSISPTEGPPESAAEHPAPEALTQTVLDLADRLGAIERDTATRFDGARAAFADLRNDVARLEQGSKRPITDLPGRRLSEFLGYQPTMEQQTELFTAFAAWHATAPKLTENRTAEYRTKRGDLVTYGWADLAAVIATAQSAARFGLCAFTRQEFDDNGHPIMTGYLVHSGGGAISSGPVPLFTAESDRPGQAHAAGLTTCRRLALQIVIGLAAERDDDFNNPTETSAPTQGGARPVATPPRRMAEPPPPNPGPARPAATARQGPPPGWLSKTDRAALEQELMDPNITPERFQQIEDRLQAAKPSAGGGAGP